MLGRAQVGDHGVHAGGGYLLLRGHHGGLRLLERRDGGVDGRAVLGGKPRTVVGGEALHGRAGAGDALGGCGDAGAERGEGSGGLELRTAQGAEGAILRVEALLRLLTEGDDLQHHLALLDDGLGEGILELPAQAERGRRGGTGVGDGGRVVGGLRLAELGDRESELVVGGGEALVEPDEQHARAGVQRRQSCGARGLRAVAVAKEQHHSGNECAGHEKADDGECEGELGEHRGNSRAGFMCVSGVSSPVF